MTTPTNGNSPAQNAQIQLSIADIDKEKDVKVSWHGGRVIKFKNKLDDNEKKIYETDLDELIAKLQTKKLHTNVSDENNKVQFNKMVDKVIEINNFNPEKGSTLGKIVRFVSEALGFNKEKTELRKQQLNQLKFHTFTEDTTYEDKSTKDTTYEFVEQLGAGLKGSVMNDQLILSILANNFPINKGEALDVYIERLDKVTPPTDAKKKLKFEENKQNLINVARVLHGDFKPTQKEGDTTEFSEIKEAFYKRLDDLKPSHDNKNQFEIEKDKLKKIYIDKAGGGILSNMS